MNKLVKYSTAALLAAGLFGMSTQTANAANGYQRLTHNAYAYNYNGQRANKKIYRKGSNVKVIGSIELNGKKYNIINGNIYIKTSNFAKRRSRSSLTGGYETSLVRNSYVYNSNGKRIKGMKLCKGHNVTYYGRPVRINGKKYVQIGDNQYVRSSNVLLAYDGPISSTTNNHTNSSNTSTSNPNTTNNSQQNTASNSSSSSNSTNTANSAPTTNGSNNQSSNTGSNQTTTNSELPTEDDYKALDALLDKAASADDADEGASSYATRKLFEDATSKGWDCMNNYMLSKSIPTTYTKADLQKMMSDIETAMKNLDGYGKEENMPVITVEESMQGRKMDLTPEVRQQVLSFVNKWKGSTDAKFVDNDENIQYTDPDGKVQKSGLWSFARQKDVQNFPWSHNNSNKNTGLNKNN
ncbi:S-layer protein [Lactobacillus helveticus]|uniref:SLAP domain-containing protein n=1 Tax=Lactobacillus helveticus TaxID=1587 RepID=UPI0015628ABD|nr:SLAP domain-containing protein [Lactobacillus helveticus]NRO60680.1 S-layer protein [Lactobacillus helveticus]